MLKIILTVEQKKNSDDCNVKIEMPKKLDKASDSEKNITSAVYQTISEALKILENKQK